MNMFVNLFIKFRLLLRVFLIGGFFISNLCHSQNQDSLKLYLKNSKTDKQRFAALMDLGYFYRDFVPDSALYYHNTANKLALKLNEEVNIAQTYRELGLDYIKVGANEKALPSYELSLKILTKYVTDPKAKKIKLAQEILSALLGDFGNYNYTHGKLPEALSYYFRALKVSEENGLIDGVAARLSSLANVYQSQGDLKKAQNFNLRALQIYKELNDKEHELAILSNIGNCFSNERNYKLSLEYYLKALSLAEGMNNKSALAILYANIGGAYDYLNKKAESITYLDSALKISVELGDKSIECAILNNIGWGNYELKKYKLAADYYKRGLKLAEELNLMDDIKDSHESLSMIYEAAGRSVDALKEYKLFITCRDSIYNNENTKKTVEAQMNFDFQRKESEAKAAQDKIDLRVAEEKQRQKIIIISVSFGLFLVLILALVIFRSLRLNQNKNKIITEQKEIVEKQKLLVEEKQKEILDSIYYARRIQRALITSETYIQSKISKLTGKV